MKADRQTLLLVDDTPDNISLLNGLLKDTYKIKIAINGEDALKIAFSNTPPDLILLDVMMPIMDGYEVLKKLKAKKSTSTIPVIFVTAKGEVEDESKGFALGCVDYIKKPFSPPIVLARVQTHLDLKNAKNRVDKLLSKTLLGSIKMMSDMISITNPILFSQSSRLKNHVYQIGRKLKLTDSWKLEIAALLSQIGKITFPITLLTKVRNNEKLTAREQKLFDAHPFIGKALLTNIPSLETIGQIVEKQIDDPPKSELKDWDYVTICGQIIKVALEYDTLIKSGRSKNDAASMMSHQKGRYSHEILKILMEIEENTPDNVSKWVKVDELKEGMILLEGIICDSKTTLLEKHTVISESILCLVQKNAKLRTIKEPIKVLAHTV
jgi:putative two-component system response regulator